MKDWKRRPAGLPDAPIRLRANWLASDERRFFARRKPFQLTSSGGENKFKAGFEGGPQYRTVIDERQPAQGRFPFTYEVFMYGELIPIGGGDDITLLKPEIKIGR